LAATLNQPIGLAIGPDQDLSLVDSNNQRISRVLAPLPAYREGEYQIPSGNGGGMDVFNAEGRHLRNVDTLTGTVLTTFEYTPEGRLASITDRDGNVTTVEYDATGAPSAIVSPDHQRTELTLDPGGYLATLTNPAGEAYQFQYDAGGLLTAFTNPR
jgi:YD repeat-containing protein